MIRFLRSARCSTTSARPDVISRLKRRNLIQDMTSANLQAHLLENRITAYTGFDPTADSLHVGNLLAIITLVHMRICGHNAIALVGGATGRIGDPSGRSGERPELDIATVQDNSEKIRRQIERIVSNAARTSTEELGKFKVVSNIDWFSTINVLDFLREAGKLTRMSDMLGRDSVKSRLNSVGGLSFTEFSYQLLQAYDFYHLHKTDLCSLQLGGSDQYGNIIAGLDLIHKKATSSTTSPAFGMTFPLLTTKAGEKFGKSAGNAVWLDASKTSVFDFYQFFVRVDDDDVERMLQYFTFLEEAEISSILSSHRLVKHERKAQHRLAEEVTTLVHGQESLAHAKTASHVLYGGDLTGLSGETIVSAFADDPRLFRISRNTSAVALVDVVVRSGACSSKSEAKKLIKSGGLYLNNRRISDPLQRITMEDFIDEQVLVLRTGKSSYTLVAFK